MFRSVLAVVVSVVLCCNAAQASQSFNVTNNEFQLNGQPFQIIAGSVHYSRVHPDQWKDRLQRLAALGANVVETYVFWNFHEEVQGEYDFSGARNLTAFLQTCQDVGLYVALRLGPYSCGEWDFGGFPWWLLDTTQFPGLKLRTYDDQYIAQVDKWWNTLLPVVKPSLIQNGGSVIMLQVENEFGSYGDVSSNPADKQYVEHLVDVARTNLGPVPLLYTTDGGNVGYMTRGTLNGSAVLSCGDGGPSGAYSAADQFNPPGFRAHLCSEYYTGWLTHWGEKMANTSSAPMVSGMVSALQTGGSVSMYMGYGGTNFGWTAGANGGGTSYSPVITSYDYDSPIGESGIHGYGSAGDDKFEAVRNGLAAYRKAHNMKPPADEPAAPTFTAYPSVSITGQTRLFDNLVALSTSTKTVANLTNVENFGQAHGVTLYSPTVSGPGSLTVKMARDRVQAFVANAGSRSNVGTYFRGGSPLSVSWTQGDKVSLLVEAMGHLGFGRGFYDPKGLLPGDVDVTASSWSVATIPLDWDQVGKLKFDAVTGPSTEPTFLTGTLSVTGTPTDTFLSLPGFKKGMVWINGFMLGRYWNSRGPQENLYVPAPLLQSGSNTLTILELDNVPTSPRIAFGTAPDFGGPTCTPVDAASATPTSHVAMFPCSGLQWTAKPTPGSDGDVSFVLNGTNLCLAMGPAKDPSTGQPAAQLATCGASGSVQTFSVDGTAVHPGGNSGTCLDITAHDVNPDAGVEQYSCNGGDNQVFTVPASGSTGVIQSGSQCLSVCNPM